MREAAQTFEFSIENPRRLYMVFNAPARAVTASADLSKMAK